MRQHLLGNSTARADRTPPVEDELVLRVGMKKENMDCLKMLCTRHKPHTQGTSYTHQIFDIRTQTIGTRMVVFE